MKLPHKFHIFKKKYIYFWSKIRINHTLQLKYTCHHLSMMTPHVTHRTFSLLRQRTIMSSSKFYSSQRFWFLTLAFSSTIIPRNLAKKYVKVHPPGQIDFFNSTYASAWSGRQCDIFTALLFVHIDMQEVREMDSFAHQTRLPTNAISLLQCFIFDRSHVINLVNSDFSRSDSSITFNFSCFGWQFASLCVKLSIKKLTFFCQNYQKKNLKILIFFARFAHNFSFTFWFEKKKADFTIF